MSPARTLSNLLRDANSPYSRLIERSGLHRELQSRLESVLGPDIAGHFTIQNLRGDTLILRADTSSWATRLRFELPRLLERLRAMQGLQQLRDIQIRVVMPVQPPFKAPRRAHLSGEAASVLEAAAAVTQDPQLRDALLRLARKASG